MFTNQTTALTELRAPGGLNAEAVGELLTAMFAGAFTPEQAGELLAAWTLRGETAIELAAMVRYLLARAVAVPEVAASMDLCGTGGSGLTRFNISTTATFILAAAGVNIAKHGNKGSARANGSFDLLEALQVPYQLPVAELMELHRRTRVCFLFARDMHPMVKALRQARQLASAKVPRTIFNLAGPLANPCRPIKQIIGVTNHRTAQIVAEAVTMLDAGRSGERTIVVCGHPGLDEVSITGATHIWDIKSGHIHHAIIDHVHQRGLEYAALPGGDSLENARIFERLLSGEERGPLLDMVCTNAGTALDCWHDHAILSDGDGFVQARALIEDGGAWAAFTRHRELATELSLSTRSHGRV